MSKYLYIFPHIQKTAGSTFRYHIRKNLRNDEWIMLSLENLEIENLLKADHKDILRASEKYIKVLDRKSREKIKVIFGQWVPYGVHKFFPNRIPRYFTFIREPLSRTVSLYNHRRKIVEEEGENKIILNNARKYLLVKGKIPSFEEWLKSKYDKSNPVISMCVYLKKLGYLSNNKNLKESIKSGFDKFYFIGTVKTFNDDSLYLYNKMGFRRYLFNQNISRKYFIIGNNREKLVNLLRKKNIDDYNLFEKAVKYNIEFKIKNYEFEGIVKKEKIRKKLLLPFTQLIYAPKDTIKLIGKKILEIL